MTGTVLSWLIADTQGTVEASINTATGAVVRRHSDPFGASRDSVVPVWGDPNGFLNQPTDTLGGTTHLGARDYDPTLGRFTSVDPMLTPADPQSINGYAYANNDPVTGSDPSGLMRRDVDDDANCPYCGRASTISSGGGPDSSCSPYCGRESNAPPVISGPGMAEISDPTYGSNKYGGVAAKVVQKSFVPGKQTGLIRISIFIPSASIHGYAGDDRSFDSDFDPSNARVSIYINLGTGEIVARQNPSCASGRRDCKVQAPDIRTSTRNGVLSVAYEASDAKQPLAAAAGLKVRGTTKIDLNSQGEVAVGGQRSDYPSYEEYYDPPGGGTTTLVQQRAGGVVPLLHLPIGLAPGAVSEYSNGMSYSTILGFTPGPGCCTPHR